jgi:hypothetical protein
MLCPKCGFENFDHAVTCMGCGYQLAQAPAPPPPAPLTAEDMAEIGAATPTFPDEIDVGAVVAETFSAYFKNVVPFSIVTVIALLPVIIGTLVLVLSPESLGGEEMVGVVAIGIMLLSILAIPLAAGAITHGVLEHIRKRPVALGRCVAVGLRMMVTIILVGILQALATFAGFLLLIIPGIIIGVALTLSVPAAVEERIGAVDALKRSWELTRGSRWKMFGVCCSCSASSASWSRSCANLDEHWPLSWPASASDFASSTSSATGLNATAAALMYYRLRSFKERLDLNELASVFD